MVVAHFSRLSKCQRQHISYRRAIWLQNCLHWTAPELLLLLQSFLSVLQGSAVATTSTASSAHRINHWLLPCCKKLWHEKIHPWVISLKLSLVRTGTQKTAEWGQLLLWIFKMSQAETSVQPVWGRLNPDWQLKLLSVCEVELVLNWRCFSRWEFLLGTALQNIQGKK